MSQLAEAITPASINYWAVLPILVVFAGALAGVLVEAFVPRTVRHTVQVALALVTLVAAFGVLVTKSVHAQGATVSGAVVVDGPSLFLSGSVLLLAILAVMLMGERFAGAGTDAFTPMGAAVPGSPLEAAATRAGWATSEVFPLALFSIAGMMIFPAAGDLLTMFVALEVLSLPLYVLTGLSRRRRLLSQEAALKYFLLGAFSSAFFLFGSALIFGYAGSVAFADIATAVSTASPTMDGLLLPGFCSSSSGCSSRSVPRRSTCGHRTFIRVRRHRSPGSWRPAQSWRPSVPSCGWSMSASTPTAGIGGWALCSSLA